MNNNKDITIGEKLKLARKEMSLSQKEVGELIGKTKHTISKIEKNKLKNIKTISKIATALFLYIDNDDQNMIIS